MKRSLPGQCLLFGFFVWALFQTFPSFALEVYESHTHINVSRDMVSVKPGGDFRVGLQMIMDDSWHIYWKNPGDSGYPVSVRWSLPEGISAGEMQWPLPKKIELEGLTSYGYDGKVLFLTNFNVDRKVRSGIPLYVKAEIKWLACKIECLPGTANVTLPVTIGLNSIRDDKIIKDFDQWEAKVPASGQGWDVAASYDQQEIRFLIEPPPSYHFSSVEFYFFPERSDLIVHSAPQTVKFEGDHFVLSVPRANSGQGNIPATIRGILTVAPGIGGQERSGVKVEVPLSQEPIVKPPRLRSLFLILIYAFLGGLILNLMPCVLPVLSIKLLHLVESARGSASKAVLDSVAFSFGIIASFWFLALIMGLLKWAGIKVGWGFQFQSPEFLVFMSVLFFWLGLNLFGVFEVGTSLTRTADFMQGSFILKNPFSNGVLATIVATPCTAPFMGSALGYALTQTLPVTLLIFTFLGLGMSVPYLLVSAFPSLLRFVPKPGMWMVTLKRIFGFFFMGTVIWLLWVFGEQKGFHATLLVLIGLYIIAISAWIIGTWAVPQYRTGVRNFARLAAISIFVLGCWIGYGGVRNPLTKGSTVEIASNGVWLPYRSELIEELKANNRDFFIDFTARWCLSCQVNEKLVLSSPDVVKEFLDRKVVLIKADWTGHDDGIAKALQGLGRNSIPVYVLYTHENYDAPKILPELLSPAIVKDALSKYIPK